MTTQPFFFTWSAQRHARPLEITGGSGYHFTTSDGGEWLDMAALVYQVNAGHGDQRIIDAIKAQADELCVATPNTIYPAKVELANKLLALAPEGYTKVFFTLGGAEANENAIKLARMVTGRYKLVSRYRSYHGATLGALSLSGDYRRAPLEPALTGAIHAMDCYCDRCPFGQTLDSCKVECAHHIGQVLRLEGDHSVSAVFLEPVPGANGVLVPHPDYWRIVREYCDEQGALLVADEVLTGFGRTGKWFGHQHFGVEPDMITVGKAITGGYGVLGAVLVHDRIARHFDDNVLLAGLTNYAHPLGIAAALKTLEVYEEDDLIAHAAEMEAPFIAGMKALQAKFPNKIRFVRGLGLLGALELDITDEAWTTLFDGLYAERVLTHPVRGKHTIVLSPPLMIDQAGLDEGFARLERAFARLAD